LQKGANLSELFDGKTIKEHAQEMNNPSVLEVLRQHEVKQAQATNAHLLSTSTTTLFSRPKQIEDSTHPKLRPKKGIETEPIESLPPIKPPKV
jgi:hypothetical protein